jgi:DnaJ-class molecular chaperone
MTTIKRPPVAYCTTCKITSHEITCVNNRCSAIISGKRCKGTMRSALSKGDWQVCSSCSGIGEREEKRCEQCNGNGHLFARIKIEFPSDDPSEP